MKRALLLILLYLAAEPGYAQERQRTKNNVQVQVADTAEGFLRRYFQIRDTYPKLAAIHGSYAASNLQLEDFMKRYHQIAATYPKLKSVWGYYAGSTYSL